MKESMQGLTSKHVCLHEDAPCAVIKRKEIRKPLKQQEASAAPQVQPEALVTNLDDAYAGKKRKRKPWQRGASAGTQGELAGTPFTTSSVCLHACIACKLPFPFCACVAKHRCCRDVCHGWGCVLGPHQGTSPCVPV